ncbi:hypothetical protein [Sodalis sp. dw_96]|uniref:hypothetical protein n=1 Tax=Sodalis sp. dw_96 TaxID=2719794 RepID=UPI001BD474D5|nr:hypothetical protein [Sodalis sp. dw_96]
MPRSYYEIQGYIGQVDNVWLSGYYDSEESADYAIDNGSNDNFVLFFRRATDFGFSQQLVITKAIVDECLNVMNRVPGATVRGQIIQVVQDQTYFDKYGKIAYNFELGSQGGGGKYDTEDTARYSALVGDQTVWGNLYLLATDGSNNPEGLITRQIIEDYYTSIHS